MSDWNAKQPKMPLDVDGNVMHYPRYGFDRWEEWLTPFHAVMEIAGTMSGRSAKYYILKDENGRTYPMFVSDLGKMIQQSTVEIKDAKLTGWWFGSKKGSNYGIKTVEPYNG